MAKEKWVPCYCTIVLGVAIIACTWWTFSYSRILLTILGALVIGKGVMNTCCCATLQKKK